MKTDLQDVQKMTVVFPKSVLERLRERVPARRRSAFIVEAVVEKLALQEQLAAIEESAGTWSDQEHPELATDQDIDRWLTELRASWDYHLLQLGVQDATETQVSAG